MMMWNNFRGSSFINKAISLFIIQAFLLSNVAFAVPAKSNINQPENQEIVISPDSIIVPRDCGMVKSKFIGSSGKLIIHIQDAHCNYEAQSNIVKILEALINNYSLGLVSVEGADGFIDTSWFKAFPDDQVRKEVADYFMKKGEITGPEFLSITTDLPFKLFGAETRSYYIDNLNAFTSSYPLKAETEKYFNSIKNVLNRLKGYIYSDELKALDSKIHDYESKKLQFNDYVRFLRDLAEHHRINLRSYENFFRLVSVLIYEKKIDFNVTDKERSALIDDLSKVLAKEQLKKLVEYSMSFKTGKVSSAEYYAYLKGLAASNNIDLAKTYPNLYNYIIYNSVYSKIENEKLFQDLKNVELAIKEKLFTNDDQRTLDKLSHHNDILLGLVNIKLMNGDFDYYQANKGEFTSEYFEDFIKKKVIQFGLAYDITPPTEAVTKSLPKLEDFYSIAIKRDKALVDNTLGAMKKERQNIAVLVTGGFHSEGIAKLLEKEGVSYMVVCPSITKDVPTPYIEILTNQRTPLENILVGTAHAKENMLAAPSRTQLIAISDRALQEYISRLSNREQLVQEIGQIKESWVEITVKGADEQITPLGRVNIEGFIERTRGATGVSVATIINELRDELRKRSRALKLSAIASEHLLALLENQLTSEDFRSLVDSFESEYNKRTGDEKTPGTGAVRSVDFNASYTEEEADMIDRAIKSTVQAGKSREVFERRTGGVFVVLDDDAYMKYAAQFNAPADIECHPGTRGTKIYYEQNRTIETYNSKVKRYYYIKESLFNRLTAEERLIFAMHEEMHIKVALGIEKCPEGMSEERFVNSKKRCDVRPAMARLGSIAHMEDMLLTDTVYGDAAVAEIGRIKREGTAQELVKFVNTVYQRRHNIDRMKSVLTEPYNGYDVIIISSSTEGEVREQKKNIGNAFEDVRTGNKILGNTVCVLSVLDTSEGGQIIGQNNTWNEAVKVTFKQWVKDARKKGISVESDDLERLYNDKSVKVATYHNGGKAERFSPAGQALSLSRADQLLVGHVLGTQGEREPIPLNLLLAVILSTSYNATSNDGSRQDVYWASQIEFGTFADIERSDFAFHKFAIALPPVPKKKDLFDYGTMIVDESGRILKFLANKTLTKKDQAGLFVENPDQNVKKQLEELRQAAKEGRAYFDYGSFSMNKEVQDTLLEYWRDVKKIFDVMHKNKKGRAGIARDIDPAFIQIVVPLINGFIGREDALAALPTSSQLDAVQDKDAMLEQAYQALTDKIDPAYREAFENIHIKAVEDLNAKEPDPSRMQALYETIEFFLRYRTTVFKDLSKAVGIIDFGTDSHWFAYKRLLDMANEKFYMLADIIGKTMELGPKGKELKNDAEIADKIRAEDARRIRRIKNDAVAIFEVNGQKISLSAEDMRKEYEENGIKIKGSIIQGNCVLLPGSDIRDSVINNSQGRIISENSYVESTTAPIINAKNSIIVKGIDKKEILADKEIVADAYRKAIPGNHQTRMRAGVDYDPKPSYDEIESSVKVKDEIDQDVKFTIDASGNVFDPNGKKVGTYAKRLNVKNPSGENIQREVYVENKETKEYSKVNGTLFDDSFVFVPDHGLSEIIEKNLKKALAQGQYYAQDDGKFAAKATSDYVLFGNNQYAFHEIREMPCDRTDNDKIEHDIRIKTFVHMLASQFGGKISAEQRLDIWVNAYLTGILQDLYNRKLYQEVFSNLGVAKLAQANQELSDKAIRTNVAYSKLAMNMVDFYTIEKYMQEFNVSQAIAEEEVPLIAAGAIMERYAQKNPKIDGIKDKSEKAKESLREWMTNQKFADYHEALKALVMEAQTNDDIAKELFDSFYKTVPFGTGGRRGKVGIGPNRINPYMTSLTTQGHCDYLVAKLIDSIKASKAGISDADAMARAKEIMKRRGVVAAYDVREFKEYYPNTNAMQKYKDIIFEKCPVMVGFSSKKMAEIDGAIYTGNGFRYYMPSEVRSTPWLSFATGNVHRILKDVNEPEYYDDRALGGTVKSSSHNLPDNNGDKFYEEDGGQAPPKESQLMLDRGSRAERIVYYGGVTNVDEAIRRARNDRDLWVDLNEGDRLDLIDEEYKSVNINELGDFVSPDSRREVKVAFNALNGTGDTCLLPILRSAGFHVLRSDGDIHDSTFPEAFEHRPSPEVEETFDAVIRIAMKDDENVLRDLQLKPVIDSDNRGLTVNIPEDVNMDAVLLEMRKLQIAEITDPDADRLGLAIKKIAVKDRAVIIKWLTANDNDESGIILFRYNIEKRLADLSKDKVYVFGTTVVSNAVEEWIVRDLAKKHGLNIVSLRHPVGFKFTGEIMTDIKNKRVTGIVGRIMKTIPVNLNGRLSDCENLADAVIKGKAEFIMSFEEGEGGIIGSKGSVDKDSGVVGLAVAMLAAEMAREDRTVYDYLQETYRLFNYGKSYLEPIVLDGADGQSKINTIVKEFETNTPMSFDLLTGDKVYVDKVENYLNMGLQEPGVKTEEESLSMILLTLKDIKIADGSTVKNAKILIRGSGTEPKIKIWVMVPADEATGLSEQKFQERQNLINDLNRDILDSLLLKAYDMTGLSYNGYSVPRDVSGRLQLLRLDFNVALSKKLGNYFPLVDKIKKRAVDICAGREDLAKSIKEFSDTKNNKDLKALESAALIKDSFRINLIYQLKSITAEGHGVTYKDLVNIAVQAALLFGKEDGMKLFNGLADELNIAVNDTVYSEINNLDSTETAEPIATPGTRAVRQGVNVVNADNIVNAILNAYSTGEEAVDAMSKDKDEPQFLQSLTAVSNELNKRYAAMTPEQRNEAWPLLERFYTALTDKALTINNIEVAKGLQIVIGNTIALQNLIDNDFEGVEQIQLTTNPAEMLKSSDANRGPSYINGLTIPANIGVGIREGAEGMYWRGAEGVSKLGSNILNDMKYVEDNKLQLDRLVMYTMLHINGFHTTVFLHDRLPGSIQHVSTGKGHFQWKKLDIKRVTRGKVVQFNDLYNLHGSLSRTTAQVVGAGEWTRALPHSIDYMSPLTRIAVFNDISVEVNPELVNNLNPLMERDTSAPVRHITIENKTVNYTVVNFAGKPILVANPQAISISQISCKDSPDIMRLAMLSEMLNAAASTNKEAIVSKLAASIVTAVSEPQQLLTVERLDSDSTSQYAAAIKAFHANYIDRSVPIKVLPLLKMYPWGLPIGVEGVTNFILKNLGATASNEQQVAGELAMVTGTKISSSDRIGESWLGKGLVVTGMVHNLPVETLSIFASDIYGPKNVEGRGAISGITAKILQASTDLSWQIHLGFAEKVTALEKTTVYVGLSKILSAEEFIRATKEGKTNIFNEVTLNPGETLIVPAKCPHAYKAGSVVIEFKDINTDSPAETYSFYDRGRLTPEEKDVITNAVQQANFDVETAKAAIQMKHPELYIKFFGREETPTQTKVNPLIRPKKDGLTIPEETLERIASEIENAGYLNKIEPSQLMLKEPILLTEKETKSEACAEIIGITEGSVGLRYTIQKGQSVRGDVFSLGSGQPLTVLKGAVRIKTDNNKEEIAEEGTQIIIPYSAKGYSIESLENESVVVTSYMPLEPEVLVNMGFEAIRANLDKVRSNKVTLLTTEKAFKRGDGNTAGSWKYEKNILRAVSAGMVDIKSIETSSVDTLKDSLKAIVGSEEGVTYVVQLTADEVDSIKGDEEIANLLKNTRLMILPNVKFADTRGIPFIREIESAGVILGNTTEKDISDKTVIAGWLKIVMSKLTGNKAIEWDALATLLKTPDPATFADRIKTLLEKLAVRIQPYEADKELHGRRELLWSV